MTKSGVLMQRKDLGRALSRLEVFIRLPGSGLHPDLIFHEELLRNKYQAFVCHS